MAKHSTAFPMFVDFPEAEFQLGFSGPTIAALVEVGELETVRVDGVALIPWDSLAAFAKRLRQRKELQTKTAQQSKNEEQKNAVPRRSRAKSLVNP